MAWIRRSALVRVGLPFAVAGTTLALPVHATAFTGVQRHSQASARAVPLAVPGSPAAASSVRSDSVVTSKPGDSPMRRWRTLVAPLPGIVGRPASGVRPLSGAQVRAAAATCARYAIRAGFANNGYYSGDLVTAAAVCVAESGGDPTIYACDANGVTVGQGHYVAGKPIKCPAGTTSYDRGLWQFNNVYAPKVSNSCAFSAVCNADQAYKYSRYGTDFSPWASYDQDIYARPFIDLVQAAVNSINRGTVTSAMLGECLGNMRSAANTPVVIAACGTASPKEVWTRSGLTIKTNSACLAVLTPKGTPHVVLRWCDGLRWQDWRLAGRDELRNVASGKCLTDPNGSLTTGTRLVAAPCANAKDQTWWLS